MAFIYLLSLFKVFIYLGVQMWVGAGVVVTKFPSRPSCK